MFTSHLKQVLSKVESYTKPEGYKVYATIYDVVSRIMSGNKHLTEAAAKSLAIRGSYKVDGGYTFSRDLRLRVPEPMMLMSDSVLSFAQEVNNRVTFPSLFILPVDSEYQESRDVIKQGLKLPECVTVKEVPGKHHVHLTHPQVVAPIIIDFLAN